MKRIGTTAVVLTLLSAMCLSGCSQAQSNAVDTNSPSLVIPSPTPIQSEMPASQEPMDEIYPVSTQEAAAQILEQAYEGFVREVTFRFTQEDLSFQERSIFL